MYDLHGNFTKKINTVDSANILKISAILNKHMHIPEHCKRLWTKFSLSQ